MINSNVTFNSILEASKRLEGKIVRTPILQSKYINENVLTNNQELLLRLSYPVLIILLLWIFKAL